METYVEKINRYVVEYQEDFSDQHKAEMRINGIDPDEHWTLKWSFEKEENAIEQMQEEKEWYANFCEKHGYSIRKQFRVRDLGETKYIKRSAWL
jgi:hypothetical protein